MLGLFVIAENATFLIEVELMAKVADVAKQLPDRRYGWDIYHRGEKLNEDDVLADLGIGQETHLMAMSEPSWVFVDSRELKKAIYDYDSGKYGNCN